MYWEVALQPLHADCLRVACMPKDGKCLVVYGMEVSHERQPYLLQHSGV